MCDIDGVVASMNKFEWLLDGNRFSGWSKFIKKYPQAVLISRGARLVDDAVDAGFQVAWSTTRPDHAAADTWQWQRANDLPAGPIMTRHHIKDGAYRDALDVKVRQWYWWLSRYGERNPVAAWIDDELEAVQLLRQHGCPAWTSVGLQRAIVKAEGRPLAAVLSEQGPSQEELDRNRARREPGWRRHEDAFQAERSVWWQKEREKAAAARARRNREFSEGAGKPTRRRSPR